MIQIYVVSSNLLSHPCLLIREYGSSQKYYLLNAPVQIPSLIFAFFTCKKKSLLQKARSSFSLNPIPSKIMLQLFIIPLEVPVLYSLLTMEVSIFYHPSIQTTLSLRPTVRSALTKPDCPFTS